MKTRQAMSTNKHPIEQEELMAYLDGELPSNRATAAVAHLEKCPECQSLAADLRRVSQELLLWEVESTNSRLPPEINAALVQRDRQPGEAATENRLNWRDSLMVRRWAWAGAFLAVCGIVGLVLKLSAPVQMANLTRRQRTATLSEPGVAADSNGLFHGLGDRSQKSLSVDGQPLSDQQSKEFDRVEQFAELQNPPGVKFQSPGLTGPMIIRAAGVTLATKDFEHARASLDGILKLHHGYFGELNVNTPTGAGRTFTATLRVPADQLDATMADLRKLGRVESESQSGQEVTAQYVDLEARLSNARNTERRLSDLLRQRTGKLSDVLAFETAISRVRGEVERMEAERKTLANQVDFATINTTVGEDYKAELQVMPVTTSRRIRNAAVEGYRTMVEGVVGLVLFLFSYGPSLLVWAAILFFPGRAAWRRLRGSSTS
jgi:hypothetical protein